MQIYNTIAYEVIAPTQDAIMWTAVKATKAPPDRTNTC